MKNNPHEFTHEQELFIREHAKGMYNKDLAEIFNKEFNTNITYKQMSNFKKRKGIKSGIDGRFQKGHVPHNKGTHTETRGRMAETQFKKGHISANNVPIGTIRKRSDGNAIKIKDGCKNDNWIPYSHYIYTQTHGVEIAKGMKVIHLDQNIYNDAPENLVLASDAEVAILNHSKNKLGKDKDINQALVTIAKIKRTMINKKRDRK